MASSAARFGKLFAVRSAWARFARLALGGAAGAMIVLVALVIVADPWRALPFSPPGDRPIMMAHQRFAYPGLLRGGTYDSVVIGGSTAMLLDPRELGRAFGGRWANVTLEDGYPWEQERIARVFLEAVARPHAILFSVDTIWCAPDVSPTPSQLRRMPLWLYDGRPWTNIVNLLNERSIETSMRLVGHALGLVRPHIRDDGYYVFVGDDARWNLDQARRLIWGERGPRAIEPVDPPAQVDDAARAAWAFPGLDKLEALVARIPPETRVVFAAMPIHVARQPRPGSAEAARDEACKERVARLAARRGTALVDFRIPSVVTREDANYWDPLHYRAAIARRIEGALETALATGADDPAGFWRVVRAR
jgi:hypothetical protein